MPGGNDILNERKQIDEIDLKILELLNKRAKISLNIRKIKQGENLPLFDAKREENVVKNLCEKNEGPLFDMNVRHLFKEIMRIMRGLPDAK